MILEKFDGLSILTSELFIKYGIKHLFTTIKDETYNKRVDYTFKNNEKEDILKNYEKIARFFKVPVSNMVKSTQIHEDNILKITNEHHGMGIVRETGITNADGIYTEIKDTPLCIFSADCVPVLIADKNKRAVFGVHSGWRGTAKNIAGKAIDIMTEELGIKKSDIICAIGPAISQCCFEVSEDVILKLNDVYKNDDCYFKKDNGKYQLDLKKVNQHLLLEKGVLKENIDVCPLCTKCEDKLFHSYRREGENSGRNAAFIMV